MAALIAKPVDALHKPTSNNLGFCLISYDVYRSQNFHVRLRPEYFTKRKECEFNISSHAIYNTSV